MAKPKFEPRLPKGMRDFLPADMIKREYVFGIVREIFHLYGFEPLQTPVLELRETLMGKYGEDAEKLIFNAQHAGGKEELALRYDLTVPLARVMGQHANEITIPFRRYQISPVWRGERPQKGRYREFYQCDIDIVGAAGQDADAEIISLIAAVLRRIGFNNFSVNINNRKLLTAIGQYAGVEGDLLGELYRSIDKFDKIGADGVRDELIKRGLSADVITRIMEMITVDLPRDQKLDFLKELMGTLPDAQTGISELRAIQDNLRLIGIAETDYDFDFTMVRGLGYYTGPIFEAIIAEGGVGSVAGGGRYDDLIGLFRTDALPTTGGSLGIERIIDVVEAFNLFPESLGGTVVQTLVTVFSDDTRAESSKLSAELRLGGIRTELYLQDKPIGRQIGYADKKGVAVVALLGEDEIASGEVRFKRLKDGQEVTVRRADAISAVKQLLG
mgnify:CR=1 FL=1